MRRLARVALVVAVTLSAARGTARGQAAAAAAADMTTDRPGFNAPASVVGAGIVQVELGWSTSRQRDGEFASAAPQPELRVGVSRHVELQVSSDGLDASCVAGCAWRGADVAFGSRGVLPMQPLGVALAATGSITLPTGHLESGPRHVQPLLIMHADRDVGEWLAVSYNYLVTRVRDGDGDDDRAAVRQGHGLSLGVSAGPWAPYVGLARRPLRVDGGVPWLAQFGTAYRLARDARLDVTVDCGLNRAEPSWGISAGLVLRRRPR